MLSILFKPEALAKMEAYIARVNTEISGFGKTEYDPYTDQIVITDIIIAPQRVTGTTTTLDRDGLAQWQQQLEASGDSVANWRLWWHSHVNMGVFWSATDTNSINDFDLQRPENNYMLSIVSNKKGEMKCRVDVFAPFRYTQDDMLWDIEAATIDTKLIDAEIERCIIKEVPAITYAQNTTGQFTKGKKAKYKQPTMGYDLATLLSTKTETDRMIAFYWGQYIKGEFTPLSVQEFNAWYKDDYGDCFVMNDNGFYIPIAPKDKRVRTAIYQEIKFVDKGAICE